MYFENNNENQVENMNDKETTINNECQELICQTTDTSITVTNSEFSEVDLCEFENVCDIVTLETVTNAVSKGALRPTDVLPIKINNDGISGVYAKRVSQMSGKSQIALVYFRSDGSCSANILLENPDLFSIVTGAYDGATDDMTKDAKRSLKRVRNKLLEYWDGTVLFNAQEVVDTVIENQNNLPIDNTQVPDIKIVYSKIVDKANELKNHPNYCGIFRKGFYAFPPELFGEIADDLKMSPKHLAEYLKRNNLLYLQGSSVAHQCKVKFFDCYCYCVRTLKEYQQTVDEVDVSELI